MEKEVHVSEVKAFKTRSGNTRFVLADDDGNEYTTFREAIARHALAAEGVRASPRTSGRPRTTTRPS